MSKKRVLAISLLGSVLLLTTLFGFAGTAPPRGSGESEPPAAAPETASVPSAADAADKGLIFAAVPRVRRVGAGIGEAPAVPGAFHFDLGVPVETVTRAYLSYELAGVPHWTATACSINGLPVQGGFGSIPASGMALQVEEINPHWLRGGNNEVLFLPVGAGEPPPLGVAKVEEGSAPAGEPVPYTVRNLRLVVFTHGSRSTAPRLRITYPVHGESEADGAFVRGFVDPSGTAGGPAELFAGDSHVPGGIRPADGTFAVFVPRTAPEGEAWDVPVEVVYPDGTRLRQTVHLRGQKPEGEDADNPSEKGETTEKAEMDAKAGEAKSLSLGGARLDVPAGALAGPVKISMRRLAAGEVPELDSGMTNVTPQKGGLRMGPHGLKFKKPVHLSLPYDPALLPKGMTEADVQTFFLDEAAGRWVPLPRSPEKAAGTAIVSLTDHFTDFVNATLAMPDEPAGSNLSSNSLQDLAKADPAAEIVQIAPPEAGPTGDAMLDFPLVVPPGRQGMRPELAVHYDSSGGNGWLGVGWDLRLPSIEVSTLFGVPRYDAAKESESYLIDGEQLAPLANPGQDRIADRGYVRRSEGRFERIVRRGSAPAGYFWEVTDKNGVRSLYGLSPQSRLRDPVSGNTFLWYLERTIDLHGNTVDYSYTTDAGGSAEPWVQVYPSAIAYTGSNGAGAFYQVRFTLDDGNQRADRLSSGRPGFKTVTRRRLAAVDVLAGGTLVRRYLFNYREGDFRKSLLESIAVTGEDGSTELYRHGFKYFEAGTGFGAPISWGSLTSVSDNKSVSAGVHGFTGVGDEICANHLGAQAGSGGGSSTTTDLFLDVNGDGLPDRIAQGDAVTFNRYDSVQGSGGFSGPARFTGTNSLGNTQQWFFDLGAGVHLLEEQGILGTNWSWNHSNDDHAVTDVNGDGLPDLIGSGAVYFNDGTRFSSGDVPFSGGGFDFSIPGEASDVLANSKLSDPLRKLILPFAGTVRITGVIQRKDSQPGADGVTVEIHHNGSPVWHRTLARDDFSTCTPDSSDTCGQGLTLQVQAGDRLYFLAGSVQKTDHDALLWAPRVAYTSAVVPEESPDPQDVTGRQGELEPYGAPRFVFDASADFRVTSQQGATWKAPATGTVRILGSLTKQATPGAEVTIAAERGSPLNLLTFAAADAGSFDATLGSFEVTAGDVIRFHLTSTQPIDPAKVVWTPTVTYEGGSYCSQAGPTQTICTPPVCPADPGSGQQWCNLTGDGAVRVPQGLVTQTAPVWMDVLPALWSQPDEVLSGGYHGWFYGEWNGNQAFHESGLKPPTSRDETPAYVAAQPAAQSIPGVAGPAWKAMGFDLYLAAEGVKPSRQGRDAPGEFEQANGPAGDGVSLVRKTTSSTVGIDASVGGEGIGAGVSLSCGAADNQLDLIDLNGDLYPDQVAGGSALSTAVSGVTGCVGLANPADRSDGAVQLGDGRGGFADQAAFPGLESPVRRTMDANLGLNAGLGINVPRKDGKGNTKAVVSTLPSVGSALSLSQTTTDLVDVNGDGLPDRVSMTPGTGVVMVRLNLGYRFGAEEPWQLPNWSSSTTSCHDDAQLGTGDLGDLTSFGTFDALRHASSSVLNAGFAFGAFGGSVGTTLSRTLVDLVDVNGDGLPDHVARDQDGGFRVKINYGDHWGSEQPWSDPAWSGSALDHHTSLFQCLDALRSTGDVNGNTSAGAPICIPLIGFGIQIELSAQVSGATGGGEISFEDFDGDGLPDRVLTGSDSTVYVKVNQAAKANLLVAVDRPLGSTITLDYRRQGNRVDRSDPSHRIDMPSSQWVLAATVLTDGRGHDYRTDYEYFDDAFYDRAERESYGYARVRATLPDGSTVDRTYQNQDLYSRYLPIKTAIADAAGNLYRVETTTYTEVPLGSQASFPAKVQESTLFYEGSATAGKSTSRTWQYDDLGNVIAMTDTGDDGPADDVHGTIVYAADPNAWVFKPQLVEAHDGTGALLRRSTATYDAAGELTRLEQTLLGGRDPQTGATYNGTRNAVWTFAYDAAGNLVSSVDPSGYTTTVTYDPQTRSYPVQVRDSFGYVTTHAYELKYGEPTSTTDENGNTLRRAYDAFGRLARIVGPDDSDASPALAFEYHPAAPVSWSVVHHKDVTRPDPIDSATFIDSLERVLETKEDAELDLGSGTSTRTGMRVSGRIEFDAKGRVFRQGQPVFDSSPASQLVDVPAKNSTVFTYDALDRVRKVDFPQGVSTRIDYGFGTLDGVSRLLTTRTDPNNRATRFYRDVDENVLGVEQTNTIAGASRILTTRYAYDALSQITSVTDALGKATRLEWDTLGRNVVLDNPDAGRTERRYDPAGNLGAEITSNLAAASKQIRYFYTFDRLDRIDYPDSPDVLYTYGAPGASANGANRIVTVVDESGTEQRSYDKLGNVVLAVKTTKSINNISPKGPYTSRFQYDSFGRLLSLTYPDGEQLTYGFDAGGQVKTATGTLRRARYDYLRHVGYDEFGERVRLLYGNNVETRYAFDPQSRYLTQLRSIAPARDLQNLAYQYDPAGTILSLQNNVAASSVPSLYGGPTSLAFQYDNLYQLTGATGSYVAALGKTSSYSLTMAYDEVGDITAKSQLHKTAPFGGTPTPQTKTSYTWSYTYGGAQPHAPTRIGDRTFRYDLNGNQTGWDSDGGTHRTITWDEENRPLSVTDSGQTTPTRFLYDAGGMRANKLGAHGETLYLSRWFSLRNGGTVSKHVFADDVRVATKVTTSAEFLFFYQPDHLGSAQFITDEQGSAYAHLEYFPSGEIWVDEHSDTLNLPFLFTGKELDDETGLSYFGYRYYEPRQGQWISADPILDEMLDLGELTSANLSNAPFFLTGHIYGYVANDPVNLVDPNGLVKTRAQSARFSISTQNIIRDKNGFKVKRLRMGVERYGIGDGTPFGIGKFANLGVPTKNATRNFKKLERYKVNRQGYMNGCHTCGAKNPGTPKGNFIPDHQPPLSLAGRLSKYNGRLFPHCQRCSSIQGGILSRMARRARRRR